MFKITLQQNKALNDLREVLRVHTKRNQEDHETHEGLLLAIQRIESQLKVSQ